jgi:hypothetical protein
MKSWSWHGTRALLLAFLLGLSMSLSSLQGGGMGAAAAVAAEGTHHAPGGCAGCGCGDHESMDAGVCLAVCGSAAQGLMPEELLTSPSAARTRFQIARLHPSGRFHGPDHGPPKIFTLG